MPCAGEVAVAAPQMTEGRPVDADPVAGRVAGQNTFLAVAEQAVGDGQVAAFQPDARPIAVRDAQILEDEAVDAARPTAQDQGRLLFAGDAVEYGGAGLLRADGDVAALLHRALRIGARRHQHRAAAIADRPDRVAQRRIASPAFLHGEGRSDTLGQRRGRDGGGDEQDRREEAHIQGYRMKRAPGQCRVMVNKILCRYGTGAKLAASERFPRDRNRSLVKK